MGLKTLTRRIYEQGGVVGADCHGIAIFDGLTLSNGTPLIQGRTVTGFSKKGEEGMKVMDWMRQNNFKTMEEIVRSNGGEWQESSNPMGDYTQVSDRIVTGMNPASAKSVAEHMMKFLPAADVSKKDAEAASKQSTTDLPSKTANLGQGQDDKLNSKTYLGERAERTA